MTPKEIQKHADKARKFYQEKPGLFGHLTVDDIYYCIRRLAELIEWQRNEIDRLRRDSRTSKYP